MQTYSAELTSAIRAWLEFGIQVKGDAHQGYFSPGGFAYTRLSQHLTELEKLPQPMQAEKDHAAFREQFHKLWGKAQENSATYVKNEWTEMDGLLNRLGVKT